MSSTTQMQAAVTHSHTFMKKNFNKNSVNSSSVWSQANAIIHVQFFLQIHNENSG